jgi:hypothetical protein
MQQAVVALIVFSKVDVFAAEEVAGAELEGVDEWQCVLAGGHMAGRGGGDAAQGSVRGRDD